MTAIKDSHLENQSFWQHDYGHYSPNSLLKFAAMITPTASGSSGRARLLPV